MGVKDWVIAAQSRLNRVSPHDLEQERSNPECVVVDIRDVRERWREGAIPGAESIPRGMLEFWADPESRYHRDFMQPGRRTILYCAEGERSALGAVMLMQLGYTDVTDLDGGFAAWRAAGLPVEPVPQPPAKSGRK